MNIEAQSDTPASDESLAVRVTQGDHAAFSELVTRHSRRFYATAYRIVMNQQDAEDMVQQAFMKLWQGTAKWESGKNAKFTTWFHRIVYNACIDLKRSKHGKVVGLDWDVQDDRESMEDVLDAQSQEEQLHATLKTLPDRQRAAITYAYIEGMKQQAIADIMGISLKAVESLLSRGKSALKERMKGYALAG